MKHQISKGFFKFKTNLLFLNNIYDFIFRKDNGFNFKVINWNDENINSSRVELNESNLNSPKILNDNKIDKNGQNKNKLELLDDNHNENSNEEKCLAAYSSPAAGHLKE